MEASASQHGLAPFLPGHFPGSPRARVRSHVLPPQEPALSGEMQEIWRNQTSKSPVGHERSQRQRSGLL